MSSQTINALFPRHPILGQPDGKMLARLEPEQILEFSETWKDGIQAAKDDPLKHGHVPKNWKDAHGVLDDDEVDSLTIFGGNRSSKTTFSAWLVVQALLKNPGTRIACWSQSDDLSKLVQQPAIFSMLPPKYRRTSGRGDCVYSLKTGFQGNSFVLPNRSQCIFRFYTQYIRDPGSFEGIELGWKGMSFEDRAPFCNIGNWFDEYLIDIGLMNHIDERLSTRDAKNLTTFTPIFQYSPTVEELLDGAVTLKTKWAELLRERVPYIQQGNQENRRIIYFHTKENRFHNYERTKRNLKGKPRKWILMKAYGVPTNDSASKFPNFSKTRNVVTPYKSKNRIWEPDGIQRDDVTLYHVCAPHGDRPWFMIWVAVTAGGDHYIYREWPSLKEHGLWAERSEGKWVIGEACSSCSGMGYDAYAQLISRLEGDESVTDRIINPKLADMLVSEMDDRAVHFSPAEKLNDEEGLQAVQGLLDNSESTRLFISKDCGNLIESMRGYDAPPGDSDPKHPWRAPVDCLKFAATSQLTHIGADRPSILRGY